LLNAEKVKKNEGKKSEKDSFGKVPLRCILMAKFQGTTEFALCYEGSSSTTWI